MIGELISICVSILWTGSALFFEYAGKKLKSVNLNLIRLIFAFILLGGILWMMSGSPLPQMTDAKTWLWMSLSGFVGFVFGDFFLFASYRIMPARFTQLIMTLAPLFAALAGFLLLGERLSGRAAIGMIVTLFGIALSILHKNSPAKPTANIASATSVATPTPAAPHRLRQFATMSGLVAGQISAILPVGSRPAAATPATPAATRASAPASSSSLRCPDSSPDRSPRLCPSASPAAATPATAAATPVPHRLHHTPDLRLTIPARGLIFAFLASIGQGVGLVLSKQGMLFYEHSALLQGTPPSTLYIPLAATQIRIITGIVCFAIIIAVMRGYRDFFSSFRQKKSIAAAFGGSIVGPVVGVSLSLLAVQHANTAIASTLMALVPIIILIPDRFLYHRRVTFLEILGAIISVYGVAILML